MAKKWITQEEYCRLEKLYDHSVRHRLVVEVCERTMLKILDLPWDGDAAIDVVWGPQTIAGLLETHGVVVKGK